MIEKRRDKRIPLKGEFLWLLGSRSARLGQVIDISRGGLSFHYIAEKRDDEKESEFIAIFDQLLKLGKVRFKSISDMEIDNRGNSEELRMRRCGGQFVDLDSRQMCLLDNLIRKHNSGGSS